MAKIVWTTQAKEDLRDLDGSARKIVLKALLKLEDHPEQRGTPLGSNPGGNLTGFRKLVVGNRAYRIVYQVTADGDVSVVWVIAKRADNEVYELAVARLQTHSHVGDELIDGLRSLLDETFEK